MRSRPRILYVTPQLPFFPGGHGGNIREYHILTRMAKYCDFDLVSLDYADNDRIGKLEKIGIKVLYVSPLPVARGKHRFFYKIRQAFGLIYQYFRGASGITPNAQAYLEKYRQMTIQVCYSDYDLIQIEHSYLLPVAKYIVESGGSPRILLTAHNIESVLTGRVARQYEFFLRRHAEFLIQSLSERMEQQLFGVVKAIIAMSEADKEWLRHEHSLPEGRVTVVPNGVDNDYFSRVMAEREDETIVFTGTLGYMPNIDAVRWFCGEILPRIRAKKPLLRFVVAGSSAGAPEDIASRCSTGLDTFLFDVPDMRPVIQSALVFVVPLRSGSGTRLKILEAMACGCAVVSTSIGAEGLGAVDGEHIIIADEVGDFVEAVNKLLDAPEDAGILGEAARKWVRREYDWNAIVERQNVVYQELMSLGHD